MTGARKRNKRRTPVVQVAMWAAPLVVAGLLVAGAFRWFGSVGSTPLEEAAEACSVGENTLEPDDDGKSLEVASGENRTGWQATVMSVCVLTELDASDSVMGEIGDAAASTGQQGDTWDDYVVTWTYGPDAGLEIVVEMGEAAVDGFQRA
jgi:hypothetical protein